MENYKNLKQSVEAVVVGNDFLSLFIAWQLKTLGTKVAYIEHKDNLADFYSYFTENTDPNKTTLSPARLLTPAKAMSDDLKSWAESHFNLQLTCQKLDPQTFESGSFKDFHGFGKRSFAAADELSFYNDNEWIFGLDQLAELKKKMKEDLKEDHIEKSQITNIEFNNNEVEAVIINEAKRLSCKSLYFCNSPKDLFQLAGDQFSWSRKFKQKIAKTPFWSTIELFFTHNNINAPEFTPLFLMGTKDDFDPTIGYFNSPTQTPEGQMQKSTWVYLANNEQIEDEEALGQIIKYMKKQIKRAVPEAFQELLYEKIQITPQHQAHIEELEMEGFLIPKSKNMYLIHPSLVEGLEWPSTLSLCKRFSESPSLLEAHVEPTV